ncbi:unnamed protein product [Oikopleura dioica]|uniref:Uncharacterized protein n=1 Tax=Oikopleura dioica TaxID=34765 RepID=E4Y6A8_OIKDI|nr:unnamed protein product [Oikopleura dioica]
MYFMYKKQESRQIRVTGCGDGPSSFAAPQEIKLSVGSTLSKAQIKSMQAVTGKITEKPKPRPQSAPMKLVTSPLALMYQTSNGAYGNRGRPVSAICRPSVHYGQSRKFSSNKLRHGMWRNCSFNIASDARARSLAKIFGNI